MPRMAMFGPPKGDIMPICYHIWEGKCSLIASNIDKAGLSCVGFFLTEVSRLETTCLKMSRATGESEEGTVSLCSSFFVGWVVVMCGHFHLNACTHTDQYFPTWCHMTSLGGSQIGQELNIHLHGFLERLSPISPSHYPFKSNHLPFIDSTPHGSTDE